MLVRTLVPREDEDDVIEDTIHCYVPGLVQVVPLRKSTATKCFTILRFNGKKVIQAKCLLQFQESPLFFSCVSSAFTIISQLNTCN